MLRSLIFVIPLVVMIGILKIYGFFINKKSRVSTSIKIIIIVLGVVFCLITAFYTFTKDPVSQQAGTLKPKFSRPYKTNNKVATSVGMDQMSQLFTVQMDEGVIVQPLGRYAPFSIKRVGDGLLVSAIIHSLDGKVIAEIRNNEWRLNPNNYFHKNFDKSALEVIDEYGIPILQVEYLDGNNIKIGGVLHLGEKETSEMYPDFPSTPKEINPRAVISFRGVIMIMGEHGYSSVSRNTSPDELRIKAGLVKPWFDYSKPKRLGIRKDSKAN